MSDKTKLDIKAEAKKKLGIIGEFKEFISKGNVIDMAIGVVIANAFTPIVKSVVDDIIMPAVGFAIGDIDFSDMRIVLKEGVSEVVDAEGVVIREAVEEVAIRYGALITLIIQFILIALCVFLMVKVINKFKRKKEEAPAEPPKPSDEVLLLTEIRDMLKEKN